MRPLPGGPTSARTAAPPTSVPSAAFVSSAAAVHSVASAAPWGRCVPGAAKVSRCRVTSARGTRSGRAAGTRGADAAAVSRAAPARFKSAP